MGGRWPLLFAIAAGLGLVGSCLVELDHRLACGDGYVDHEAGEECDPEDPEQAFESICPDDKGQCHPTRCTFDDSECSICGNHRLDAGEECEPGNETAAPRPCAGGIGEDGEELAPLRSPYVDTPYTAGQATECLADCTWARTECSYCGNGRVEGEVYLALPTQANPNVMSRAEWCDGEVADPDRRAAVIDCGSSAIGNVDCAADCRGFVLRAGEPKCCLPQGAECPADDDVARCCHEFTAPDVDEHCTDFFADPSRPAPEGSGGKTCK